MRRTIGLITKATTVDTTHQRACRGQRQHLMYQQRLAQAHHTPSNTQLSRRMPPYRAHSPNHSSNSL